MMSSKSPLAKANVPTMPAVVLGASQENKATYGDAMTAATRTIKIRKIGMIMDDQTAMNSTAQTAREYRR